MIEFSTGAMFLVSSLYGSGQTTSQLASAATSIKTWDASAATSKVVTLQNKDNKDFNSVEAYVREQYADTPILIEVARCESQFHQFNTDGTVVRGIENKLDVGVMQINEKYHAETAKKLGINLYTTEGNVAFGKYLYSKYGSDPWNFSSKCWAGKDLARK